MELARVLAPLVAELHLPSGEWLPCILEQDETPNRPEISYSESRDALLGCCGWVGDEYIGCHSECSSSMMVVLGDSELTQKKVDDLCDRGVRASYIRLCVLKPLSKQLPRLIVSLVPSDNRFRTMHVQMDWVKMDELFDKYLKPLQLCRMSHGTDGDARYAAAQKANMTHKVTWASGEATSHWQDPTRLGSPFYIAHESFSLTGWRLPDGTISNIEMSDCRHIVWLGCARGCRRGSGRGCGRGCGRRRGRGTWAWVWAWA